MAYFELTITTPPALKERVIALLNSKGCLGFIDEEQTLKAYFPDTFELGSLLKELELVKALLDATTSGEFQFSSTLLPDTDWNESWKKGFVPLDVGSRFTILPPWEREHESRINLIIDPGMAFGTGHHETTRSCLILMERYYGKAGKGRFLDLGTGTGLLAIAASRLGFREVLALDTDPLATQAARMNITLNHAEHIVVREGSISRAPGRFDMIAANIISGVLILLAPALAARLERNGFLILSGILEDQAPEVIAEMEKAGLHLLETLPDGKWISLVVAH